MDKRQNVEIKTESLEQDWRDLMEQFNLGDVLAGELRRSGYQNQAPPSQQQRCLPSDRGQGHRPQTQLSGLQLRILQMLVAVPNGTAMPTMQLMHALKLERKSQLNPLLYQMQRRRWVFKSTEVPPCWMITPEGKVVFFEHLN